MTRLGVFVVIWATLILPGTLGKVSVVSAAEPEKKPKKEMSLREKFALPSHIQMTPMMVPIKHRYQTTAAVTFFLEPVSRDAVGKICNNVPRIRDAILRVLSRDPVPTRYNKLVLDGIDGKLVAPINTALPKEKIKSIHIEAGMVNLAGRAGGISRLPFATINGCSGIKEMEEKLEAAKAKEKEK